MQSHASITNQDYPIAPHSKRHRMLHPEPRLSDCSSLEAPSNAASRTKTIRLLLTRSAIECCLRTNLWVPRPNPRLDVNYWLNPPMGAIMVGSSIDRRQVPISIVLCCRRFVIRNKTVRLDRSLAPTITSSTQPENPIVILRPCRLLTRSDHHLLHTTREPDRDPASMSIAHSL